MADGTAVDISQLEIGAKRKVQGSE